MLVTARSRAHSVAYRRVRNCGSDWYQPRRCATRTRQPHIVAQCVVEGRFCGHPHCLPSRAPRRVCLSPPCAAAEFLANDGDVRKLVGSGDKSDLAVHRMQERGFFIVDGYNNKQIFSNLQFKIGLALRDAGLHGSDFAREAMMRLAKPPR